MIKVKNPKMDVNQIAKMLVDRVTDQEKIASKPKSAKKKNSKKKS